MSINLPTSTQLVGARATRTTHPLVLEHFRRFFSAALGQPIEFDNPFIWKTKAEVIQSIVDHGGGELIKDTVSCTRVRDMTRLHTHCGCCVQCLDRRFSILAANASKHDPPSMYKVELLAGPRETPKDQTLAESYVRTALELREMGELAFIDRFGGETTRVCAGFPALPPDEVGRNVLELHQRHGEAIGDVLKKAIKRHSAEFLNRKLPTSSVLMMTVAPGTAPALDQADTLQSWFNKVEKGVEAGVSDGIAQPATIKEPPSIAFNVRKRGRLPLKLQQAKEAMQRDLHEGRENLASLRAMLEKNLAQKYGVSRDTARKARRGVLSEFVENSITDKYTANDK